MLHHILFFLVTIAWNSSGSKGANMEKKKKNPSHFQDVYGFKMFYSSLTSLQPP